MNLHTFNLPVIVFFNIWPLPLDCIHRCRNAILCKPFRFLDEKQTYQCWPHLDGHFGAHKCPYITYWKECMLWYHLLPLASKRKENRQQEIRERKNVSTGNAFSKAEKQCTGRGSVRRQNNEEDFWLKCKQRNMWTHHSPGCFYHTFSVYYTCWF